MNDIPGQSTDQERKSMPKTTDPLERMQQNCDLLSEVESDTNKLAARLWTISINYFELVQGQAQRTSGRL